jgi:GT2 family glycosyltransferase
VSRSDGGAAAADRAAPPGGPVVAIVLTRNRKDSLRWCLEGIREQTLPVQRIIVIDNGSDDGTAEMLRAEFPAVEHRRMPENLGASGGFAEGFRAAMERRPAWVWCLTDDCRPVTRDALSRLVGQARAHERVGLARGIMKDERTGTMQGACPFVGTLHPAEVIETCGVPREDLFFEFEDTEYWYRLEEHGYRVLTCEDVVVWHPWRASTWTLGTLLRKGVGSAPWRMYYRFRNRVFYYSRKGQWKELARTLYWMVKWLVLAMVFGPRRVMHARMILRGLVDGLRGDLGRRVEPPSVPS